MTLQSLLAEPNRQDEPHEGPAYAAVVSQVASEGRPVILRRNGEDLAAIIPLEYLELMREVLARPDVEKLAAQIDWDRARKVLLPSPEWLEGDEPKPF
jgi:hypothetical protein